MAMRYGSVCSGIEAATTAWHPLGWRPQFFSEIDAAPRAVLAHRWPEVPLHGDFTTIQDGAYGPIDLLVGGTPCQSFSVAGLRGGLADDRGNLALGFLRLADRLRPRWLVWENVPGVLSSNGGRDFGAILGGMVELGYGFAYRVLDAQHVRVDGFGRAVPQRRRRVFVVGHLGDWRRPAAVLLERASLRGDPAPRREAETGVAAGALAGVGPGSGWRIGPDEAAAGHLVAATLDASFGRLQGASPQDARHGHSHLVAATLEATAGRSRGAGTPVGMLAAFGGNDTRGPIQVATAVNAHGGPHGRLDFESETFVAFQGRGSNLGIAGDVAATMGTNADRASGGAPCIAFDTTQITSRENRCRPEPGDPCHPLAAQGHPPAIAFSCKDHGADATDEGVTPTLRAMGHGASHANAGGQMAVALHARQDSFTEETCTPPLDTDAGTVAVRQGWAVRRLTPRECERLQGFPDDWTLVPWRAGLMPDGPRYKMLGNSMAVNAMRWIGRRIEMVETISAIPLLQAAE